jgi:rfaE bifunctional protein kinase chain/domain
MSRADAGTGGADFGAIIERMRGAAVCVVGDLIADLYVHTRPARLSREAPVLIVHHEREELIPGGAANTARNLAALGAKVWLVADVGTDAAGGEVIEQLGAAGVDTAGILRRDDRPTVTKTRVLAGDPHRTKQQLVRIDKEPRRGAVQPRTAETLSRLERVAKHVGAFLVSDYDYDLLSPPVVEWLCARAATTPVVVDSRHRLPRFTGVTVITPNEEEAEVAAGMRIESREEALEAGGRLLVQQRVGSVLLTRGKHGMMLFARDAAPIEFPVVGKGEVVDVSGAGDTVVAAFTAARLAGAPLPLATWISNAAASVVVMKVGAATCAPEELRKSLAAAPPPASAIRPVTA